MKLAKLSTARSEENDPENHVHTDLTNLFLFTQGRVRFGTGTDGDRGENIAGEFQVFTSNATPDTADSITHTLGSVPIGFIVINMDKGAVIYDSGTAWTSTTISLKTNTASTTATIFLLK
jgi:hypothetical protein